MIAAAEIKVVLPSRRQIASVSAILIASAVAGALIYSQFVNRAEPVLTHPFRIGFEPNPPFQTRTDKGFGGLAVEIINQAATRADVKLQWVETGKSSEESLRGRLVDLWPLTTDLPERRSLMHFSAPWMMSSHILLLRAGSEIPDQNFAGPIALFSLPLHLQLLKEMYPRARPVPISDARRVVREVCTGMVPAGFLEKRVAMNALNESYSECGSVAVRALPLPKLTLKMCVASTFEAAPAADLLRREIGNMYRDGSLAQILGKYTFYGLDEAWATYDLLQSAERGRALAWGTGAFAVLLTLGLWQLFYVRQRRRSERVLRESEERFRAIFHQAGVGVAQISVDGKVEIANDRYCEVVGHSPKVLVGRTTVELTHREDLQTEAVMVPKLLAGEIQSFTTEKRYIHENGATVWATMCRTLVRDGHGQPKCFIGVVENITERKEAEEFLRESEKRFRNLADSAPVLIWMSGPDKACTFANKGWLEFTGSALERSLKNGWIEFVHPSDRELCMSIYTSAFDARRDYQFECRLRRADGEYRWFLNRGVTRFLDSGMFAGFIGCSLDITDLKRGHDQHLATQKLESVGVLAAGVAHDFNNVLGAIVSLAESALQELVPTSPAADDIGKIREKALAAAQIASQLMTYTHQDNVPATALDLSSLIAEMLPLLRVSISKSADLETSLGADLPPIYANRSELGQVVMNLVVNASEALEGKPGSITIRTQGERDGAGLPQVRLEVTDTGVGITEETKARIFDPYFTTRFAGRGLGLSAVQGIIRRVGGTIEVASVPNGGSQFIVLLPGIDAVPTANAVAPASAERAQTCRTVLLIEDEESLRSPVARLLRKNLFNVIEAQDGPAGLQRFQEAGPASIDVVLLDVTLPGMQGPEILDELRRISPDVKILVCTAYDRETVLAEFGERQFSGYIRKPYRSEELMKLLDACANALS